MGHSTTEDARLQNLAIQLSMQAAAASMQIWSLADEKEFWEARDRVRKALVDRKTLHEVQTHMVSFDQMLDEQIVALEMQRHDVISFLAGLSEPDFRVTVATISAGEERQWNNTGMLARLAGLSRNPAAYDYLLGCLQEPRTLWLETRRTPSQRFAERLIPYFRRARSERDEYARAFGLTAVISALSLLGDRRAIEAMRPYLSDENESVRLKAKSALDRLTQQSADTP